MTKYIINNLVEVKDLLKGLSKEQYSRKLEILTNASIGQHVRHILEFYQCLLSGIESGTANYDTRKRDLKLEENVSFALATIEDVINRILELKSDRPLILNVNYDLEKNKTLELKTSLYRELAYNLEHSIHHQALIKVAISEMKLANLVKSNFGIAPSTIRHNKENVHSNIHTN